MTRDEILAMKPGRELTKLVAIHVMKYQIYHYDKDRKENCYYMLVDEEGNAVTDEIGLHAGERKTEEEAWDDCPKFSEDITAAWEAEAKIAELGLADGYCNELFRICWTDRGGKNDHAGIVASLWYLVHATSEQRCKAALLAKLEAEEGTD